MKLMEIIKGRRSVRKFTQEPVPDDVIQKLMEAARWAPTPSNLQGTKFVVVKNQDINRELANAVREVLDNIEAYSLSGEMKSYFKKARRFFTNFDMAPVVIYVAYKQRQPFIHTIPGWPIFSESMIAEVSGAAAAVQNILLMAHSLGYGSCWMTGPLLAEHEIARVLGLDRNHKLAAVIPIGKADGSVNIPDRKELNKIMKVVE